MSFQYVLLPPRPGLPRTQPAYEPLEKRPLVETSEEMERILARGIGDACVCVATEELRHRIEMAHSGCT